MNDPAQKHNTPAKEAPLGDRSPWFSTSSMLSPYRDIFWCFILNEPTILVRSKDYTKEEPVLMCPNCKQDDDTNGEDFDHTFMGHALKPLSTRRAQQ